jgi:hypothetical protein
MHKHTQHTRDNEREIMEGEHRSPDAGSEREIMKSEHGRGQRTAGDREIMEPGEPKAKRTHSG